MSWTETPLRQMLNIKHPFHNYAKGTLMFSESNYDIENNLFIGLFNAMPFSVYVADINTFELIFVNKKLQNSISNRQGRKCYQAIYSKDSPCSHCPISNLVDDNHLPNGISQVSELFNDVDDNWYQLEDKCISWPDGRIAKYSISINITELKQAQNSLAEAHAELALKAKSLERLSITDALTQLFNRLRINQILDQEMSRSKRYGGEMSVIMIDLDNFKQVNDSHGHLVGDLVLKQTAKLLKTTLREHDAIARWGGEEFMLVCPQTTLEQAMQVAEKLRSVIANAVFPEVNKVTCSLGVASYTINETRDLLIGRADRALYKAKSLGRNQVSFEGSEPIA
jgi:diguanylate cyclase (GGDEF)-like protein